MSGKRRSKPGVRVICTDSYHRDSEEFARHGFRFLCKMELLPMTAGGYWLNLAGLSPAAVSPVKRVVHPGGERTYCFKCTCGRYLQRHGDKLMAAILARIAATGATDPLAARIDLDITTI
jgi:hypothetical protein